MLLHRNENEFNFTCVTEHGSTGSGPFGDLRKVIMEYCEMEKQMNDAVAAAEAVKLAVSITSSTLKLQCPPSSCEIKHALKFRGGLNRWALSKCGQCPGTYQLRECLKYTIFKIFTSQNLETFCNIKNFSEGIQSVPCVGSINSVLGIGSIRLVHGVGQF